MELRELRKARGLSQLALAEKSGVNVRQIQRIELGESSMGNVTFANAKRLADALQIPMEDLLK